MGVVTVSDEYTSPVPAARLFQALVVDYSNLIPKLVPQVIMSVDVYPPEGGVESIRHIIFAEGCELGYVKNRVEELNEETHTYKCTTIERGPLTEGRIETFVYEAKIEPVAEGCEPGYVKNRVEELNEETQTYKCTTIEGGPLTEGRIETFVYEAKIEPEAVRWERKQDD
ncbi:hypothetical protein MLD38_019634 [Melastoma candidum]|uniref:Uncharacterized protein n=1 Tax=Melastoma candidum TaxID=119954 RepID=A0ACB9QYQ6_9MYRT|nr:hypothetical protein MLD38_019634 [Melastoma candidum]